MTTKTPVSLVKGSTSKPPTFKGVRYRIEIADTQDGRVVVTVNNSNEPGVTLPHISQADDLSRHVLIELQALIHDTGMPATVVFHSDE
jgi:hypothetical protein